MSTRGNFTGLAVLFAGCGIALAIGCSDSSSNNDTSSPDGGAAGAAAGDANPNAGADGGQTNPSGGADAGNAAGDGGALATAGAADAAQAGAGGEVSVGEHELGPALGWSAETRVDSAGENARAAAFAFERNATGNAVAVWEQSDGTHTHIWANRFVGGAWGTATLIGPDALGNATEPHVVVDAQGNATAIWLQGDGSQAFDIRTSRFDVQSGTWSMPQAHTTNNTGSARAPQIAGDVYGSVLAVWSQEYGEGGTVFGSHVMSAFFNARTQLPGWEVSRTLDHTNNERCGEPRVAMNESGDGLVIWAQSPGATQDIEAARFVATGAFEQPVLVTASTTAVDTPDAAIDDSGSAVAAWRAQNEQGAWGPSLSVFAVLPHAWSPAVSLHVAAADIGSPRVAFVNGIYATAWWQRDAPDAPSRIFCARGHVDNSAGSGDQYAAELLLSEHAGNAYDPVVAVDPTGNIAVAWDQFFVRASNILTARFTTGLDSWATGVLQSERTHSASAPTLAFRFRSAEGMALWSEDDGNTPPIAHILSSYFTP